MTETNRPKLDMRRLLLRRGLTVCLITAAIGAVWLLLEVWLFLEANVLSPWFLRMFSSQCAGAMALPSSSRITQCSVMDGFPDWTDETHAKVDRDEFEAFLAKLGYSDRKQLMETRRLTSADKVVFERIDATDGAIRIHVEYGTRVFVDIGWSDGDLGYFAHSE